MAEHDLEVLYREAQAALKARDYARASELLKQILLEDHDYKDVSRLLAQVVKLRRRRWYNHPLLWSAVGAAIVLALGFAIAPRLREIYASQMPASTVNPTATSAPTDAPKPTETLVPTPTSIPLVWRRLYVGQEFDRDKVIWFGMDSKDKDVLYVGMENAGTYQSIDGGLSWQPINSSDVGDMTKFDLDWEFGDDGSQSIRHTAADGKERIYYSSGNYGGWSISENGGKNRREIYFGGNVTPAIAFNPNGELYIQCDWNLCKFSPDGKQKTILGRPDIGEINVIAVSFFDSNTIFVGGTGFAISNDGGLTWTKANNGLGATTLKLDNAAETQGTFFLQTGDCFVDWYADPKRQKMEQPLFRSEDGGQTWSPLTKTGCALALDADGKTLYRHGVPPGNGSISGYRIGWLWRSSDEGSTWQRLTTGPAVYAMIANPYQSGEIMLFAGADWYYTDTPDRQFLSQNYGETWNTFNLTIENFDFGGGNTYNVQYGPIPNLIYLTPRYQEMYRSEDNGIEWSRCNNPFESNDIERQLLIDPRNGKHLLIAQTLNAVYESTDGCEIWRPNAASVDDEAIVNALALDPKNPDTVYAGTDGGAYISFDFGQTWNQINDGLLGATVVYSIVVDHDSNVYAATPYGIFELENK